MRKGKKALGLIAIALMATVILMAPAMAEIFRHEDDWTETGETPEMLDWLGDEPTTTNVSDAGLIILVILVFGGAIGAIVLINKFQEHQKKIEELEQQLKEKKEKE